MAGKLFLCATPIGNLEDITLRVLRTLREADLIAAEDTRNTIKLLKHFKIKTPLTSYHEYNKIEKAYQLAAKIKEGKNVALVTDAGTPGISDPGEDLVRICIEQGILVSSLPGPAACITGLTIAGLSTKRFAFEAFLPADKKQRSRILKGLEEETRTIILYEAPHHLKHTLEDLYQALGNRKIALCRELTKIHEEVVRATLESAIAFYKGQEPRGEYVLVLEGASHLEIEHKRQEAWQSMALPEHMQYYESQGVTHKEAMKLVAKDRGITKRDVYQQLHVFNG